MATIKGVWVFNESISLEGLSFTEINFSSDNTNFSNINLTSGFTSSLLYNNNQVADIDNLGSTTWINQTYRTVDFGDTEQEVSEEFYTWFTANATKQEATEPEEPDTPTSTITITYNEQTTELTEGQTATLPCSGKMAKTDIVINFLTAGSITYNGTTTDVESGKVATLACTGKKMVSDVIIAFKSAMEELAAPEIELEGDTLTIYDETNAATSFDILVDGEVKDSVNKVVE